MRSPSPANPAVVAFAYALVCVVWGSTYLFIKLGVSVLPPYLLGGARFTLAGVALLTGCLATGRRLPRDRAVLLDIAIVGVLLLVVGNGLLNSSERYISSGLAALLVATFPLWTTLLAMTGRESERLSSLGWGGLAVGLLGVAILVHPFDDGGGYSLAGVVMVLAASFAWAVGTVYARRRIRAVDPFTASAIETSVAGPLMLAIHFLFESDQAVTWGGQAWLAVGYLAGIGSLVGFTAFVYITAHMSSSKVGTYAYVNPVVAVFLGWWVLDESVTWWLLLGGGTVIAGLLLVYTARVQRAVEEPEGPVVTAPKEG